MPPVPPPPPPPVNSHIPRLVKIRLDMGENPPPISAISRYDPPGNIEGKFKENVRKSTLRPQTIQVLPPPLSHPAPSSSSHSPTERYPECTTASCFCKFNNRTGSYANPYDNTCHTYYNCWELAGARGGHIITCPRFTVYNATASAEDMPCVSHGREPQAMVVSGDVPYCVAISLANKS
jgi:hypothetical protein